MLPMPKCLFDALCRSKSCCCVMCNNSSERSNKYTDEMY